ncbi:MULTISPECIES: MarR family transcriptional regulator [Actinoplanes]|uniref:MarR family winged helix-turn-helix transcriptional regulator n=1 Tax=Actinoplanes TaxID=1865 RepID=UPI0005F2F23F|nr:MULTISPECIES: MarR family transcriptional regulator [Actinoplanes]GLY05596.1 MarR family transcriptional regulator [Actinoplanes sp. NBRC 101535]
MEDLICFALYAASRSVTAVYRPLLERLHLTYPQYLVMTVLWQRGASPIKEISGALQLDYGTLTPLLKRLETLGYVRRERRPDDERSVIVTLTAEGEALREQARDVPIEITQAMGLTPEATAVLRDTLRQITENTAAYTASQTRSNGSA